MMDRWIDERKESLEDSWFIKGAQFETPIWHDSGLCVKFKMLIATMVLILHTT